MTTAEDVSAGSGVGAALVPTGAILLATVLSPTFSWTGDALSNLGGAGDPAATATTMLLFNGGLVVGGLLGVGFVYVLFVRAAHVAERIGAVAFGLSMVALALVGVFPQEQPAHFPAAVSFYLLLSVALWLYGTGNLFVGERERGLATMLLGVVNVAAWVGWGLTGPVLRPGLALPEIVGALVLAGWAVVTAWGFLDGRRTGTLAVSRRVN
jgi:hypothetical membrane protein